MEKKRATAFFFKQRQTPGGDVYVFKFQEEKVEINGWKNFQKKGGLDQNEGYLSRREEKNLPPTEGGVNDGERKKTFIQQKEKA